MTVTISPMKASGAAAPSSPRDSRYRRLDMNAEEGDEVSEVPTVYDLMQEVTRLQQAVRDLSDGEVYNIEDEDAVQDLYTTEWTRLRSRQKDSIYSGSSDSFSRPGIYSGRNIATNVGKMSPYKNISVIARGDRNSSVAAPTPPRKRRESPIVSRTVPHPTRVAALTRENVSLLPTPRAQNFTGSVCGSQKSRTSIRTDGGAVYSRLYQPDFYKNREEKLKNMRDRHEVLNCTFTPRTTSRRDSISSRDSIGSQTSMLSAKTDVGNVSRRLYDPDYVRKRNARLQRMRQEREMRECTFRPTINANAFATPRKKL